MTPVYAQTHIHENLQETNPSKSVLYTEPQICFVYKIKIYSCVKTCKANCIAGIQFCNCHEAAKSGKITPMVTLTDEIPEQSPQDSNN